LKTQATDFASTEPNRGVASANYLLNMNGSLVFATDGNDPSARLTDVSATTAGPTIGFGPWCLSFERASWFGRNTDVSRSRQLATAIATAGTVPDHERNEC